MRKLRHPADLVGEVVGGYRLVTLLGTGMSGAVYVGEGVNASGATLRHALKVFLPDPALSEDASADLRTRFLRETILAAALRHPSIVPILSCGDDRGVLYMVQPYYAGGTLAMRIAALRQAGQQMPFAEIAAHLRRLAAALDHAHMQGIIHRDVKPANVVLDTDGTAYLTDFSIARTMHPTTTLTHTGTIIGTVDFASPEQLQDSRSVGPAADLYSLGAVIYFLMTGVTPFPAVELPTLLTSILFEPPRPPRHWRPELPPAAELVLLRALAKDPQERFPTADAFAQALLEALQDISEAGAPSTSAMRCVHTHSRAGRKQTLEEQSVDLPPTAGRSTPSGSGARDLPLYVLALVVEHGMVVIGQAGIIGAVEVVVVDRESVLEGWLELTALVVRGHMDNKDYLVSMSHLRGATKHSLYTDLVDANLAAHPRTAPPYDPAKYTPVGSAGPHHFWVPLRSVV